MRDLFKPAIVSSGVPSRFGFWIGFAINFTTIVTGSMICFFIGRYVATDTIRSWLVKRRETAMVTRIIENNDFKFLVLFRFMPLPLCVKNYAPSTIRVLRVLNRISFYLRR